MTATQIVLGNAVLTAIGATAGALLVAWLFWRKVHDFIAIPSPEDKD